MYTPTWLKQIDLFQTSTESRSAIREWHVFYITGRRDAVRYSGRCAQRCTTSSTDWGATSAVFLHLAEREREQGQIRKEVSLFFFLLQGIRKELSVRPRPRSWRPMWREGGRVQTAKPPAGLRGAGPLAPVATGKSGTFGQHTVVISIFTW